MGGNALKADAAGLRRFMASALAKVGVPERDAATTAEILVDADLRGIESHGLLNFYDYYYKKVRDGDIQGRPRIRVSRGSPTTAVVDGDNGLGLVVGHRAMEEALSMAEESGSGWVSVCGSNHCGAGAYYVLMAARRNMLGFHVSTGGSTVAGPGGTGRLVGNNVIAFAAPAKKHDPFVLDMAPTMAIANKIRRFGWEGKPIPPGFAVDRKGEPITDPEEYFRQEGAILPLGSSPLYGIHKGFGLILMVDILAGVLSGDGGSTLRKKGAETHAFGALRIDAFPSGADFPGLMEEMIGRIHGAPTVEGSGPMRYPGERMGRVYRERLRDGIPLNEAMIADLRKLSAEQNLPLEDVFIR